MWQFILGIGLLFLVLEMLTPILFFLNFALAAFICAPLWVLVHKFFPNHDISIIITTFCVLSIIMLYTIRPLLIKKRGDKSTTTGIESKYIGKIAHAIEDINQDAGAISLYDERWQARNVDEGTIPKGSKVRITGNESIVMYVKKVN